MDDSCTERGGASVLLKEDLTATERLLVWAIRVWVAHHRAGAVPCRGYSYAFVRVGLPDAPLLLHRFMQLIAANARRGINIRCIGCPQVSPDERRVLTALAAAQRGELAVVQALLRDVIEDSTVNWVHAVLATLAAQMTTPEHRLPRRDRGTGERREATPALTGPMLSGPARPACVDPGGSLVH